MNHEAQQIELCPVWLRFSVIAAATIILCACSTPVTHVVTTTSQEEVEAETSTEPESVAIDRQGPTPAPPVEYPPPESLDPPPMIHAADIPLATCGDCPAASPNALPPGAYGPAGMLAGQWRPPGIAGPWPPDEYVCDGGDYILPAEVRDDWTVAGIEPEDTIAHFDTLDGRTLVRPSNRVCVYAPRFGAVRHVDNLAVHEVHDRLAGLEVPQRLAQENELGVPTTSLQQLQPHGADGTKAASLYRGRQQGGGLENLQGAAGLQDALLPYENFAVIRSGVFDNAEKARLATRVQAAITWSNVQAVQVIIDNQPALIARSTNSAESVYRLDEPDAPELRIVKVASTSAARPGEFVDFTLRFDNIGDQTIGNVAIIDNLATRLQYVEDSQECSLEAEFIAQPNQVGSLALRWDLAEPLEPGEGGIIRFRCRVR